MSYNIVSQWLSHVNIEELRGLINGRKVCVWGGEQVTLAVKEGLGEKIKIQFFIDNFRTQGDIFRDGIPVVTGDELESSEEWFIIITNSRTLPEEMLIQLKSKKFIMNCDYICISSSVGIINVSNGYKDWNGNEIICTEPAELKLKLEGYQNQLTIEDENNTLKNVDIMLKGNAKLYIGKGCIFTEKCRIEVYDGEVIFGAGCVLKESSLCIIGGKMRMKAHCELRQNNVNVEQGGSIELDERCLMEQNVVMWANTGGHICINSGSRLGPQSGVMALRFGEIEIGKGVSICSFSLLCVAYPESFIHIGDDCMFSYQVSIWGDNGHALIDLQNSENTSDTSKIGVTIEDHVWLGNKVTVLPGSVIGAGSMAGANSLVTGSFNGNQVLAGNPARVIHSNYTWDREAIFNESMEKYMNNKF